MKGKFITFEGIDGAGKSSHIEWLAEYLRVHGKTVIVTREPGGTALGEQLRSLLLAQPMHLETETLLMFAARREHLARVIEPALERGDWVICDRFIDSSRAYQGGAGGLSDADVLALHGIGSVGLLPDLTLLIEVSPETATARTSARDVDGADRIGGRDASYHARVAEAFARLADAEPARFARIDGNGTADAVHAAVLTALGGLVEGA